MRRQVIGFLSMLLLVSCASSLREVMQAWVGHSADELMMKWGRPSQVVDNPSGGKVFVYVSSVEPMSITTDGYIDASGNFQATTYDAGGVPTPTRVLMFFANSSGIIYAWRLQGI